MTTYQLPDMPAKIPAIDDDKLKELLKSGIEAPATPFDDGLPRRGLVPPGEPRRIQGRRPA